MKLLGSSLTLTALAAAASVASAQVQLPFSAQATPSSLGLPGVIDIQPDTDTFAELTGLDAVLLTDVPMPGGHVYDLELTRRSFDPMSIGVYVDGKPAIWNQGDFTMWEGKVAGTTEGGVSLSFSSHGSYGWIDDGTTHVNVTSFPHATQGWAAAGIRMFTEEMHLTLGPGTGHECAADTITGQGSMINPEQVPNPGWNGVTLECRIAVETDYQFYQNWNNLNAAQNYLFQLLGAISDRYLSQIDTVLSFPYVQFYTNTNDPWSSTSSGGRLTEFQSAWAGNIPGDAHLAHMISGANLGGGVAWLGTLCNGNNGFAVSGNINGGTNFPVNQGSDTWDFVVVAHETGHNFGAPHTHDYCPPLDTCAGNCTGSTSCSNGTIMSYCHSCGGMNNITTFFHPTVVNTMRNGAESSCIPNHNGTNRTILFSDDFESGDLVAGGWSHGNLPGQVITAASYNGTYGCRIRNKRFIYKDFDTTGYSTITVEVWRRTMNYDGTEHLRLRVHNGSSWNTVEEFNTNNWGRASVQLPASAGNNPNLEIRFKSKGSQGNERCDIDQIVIYGQ
ncbi:MAG: hypothetical protein ACI841_004385 [Planctomycetota bacterium]|jgi:hypothetical protein